MAGGDAGEGDVIGRSTGAASTPVGRRLRILVNAASANMGGALTYLRHFAERVPAATPECEYLIYAPPAALEALAGSRASRATANVELRAYPFRSTGGAARYYFDQVVIPRIVRQEGIDVLFSSTGFATFRPGCAQIVLIRNALLFDPRYRSRSFVRRRLSTAAVRWADLVITPTEAMRKLLDPSVRAVAIPYGIDLDAFLGAAPEPAALGRMREWRAAGDIVLLYVSSYATHKGFESLVNALALLRADGVPVRLMTTLSRAVTGEAAEYDALLARVHDLDLDESVGMAGHLPYAQLHHLYAAADLFVFPSLCESFGHPMVEALASGLPIVAAGTEVNREICGEAACYFEPGSATSLATAVRRLVHDPRLRSRLVDNAHIQVRGYSWDAYARGFVQAMYGARRRHSRLQAIPLPGRKAPAPASPAPAGESVELPSG